MPAIGSPNLNIKLEILDHNLKYIYNNIKIKFSISLNCYDNFKVINDFICKYSFLDNSYTYNKKGVLTELWLTNPHNTNLSEYDYILFILDDVKIKNLDIKTLIDIKNKYQLNVLSPKVINSTYAYLNKYDNLLITNQLEVYCLLLTFNDFNQYASINTTENKWMWGVDLLFWFFNIKTGIYNKNVVKHMLASNSDQRCASKLGRKYIQKHGFKSLKNLISRNPIKEIIEIKN